MSTRKIIDPKQNGEKVWLKGHAQAIYMSDGTTVEDAIHNIETGADLSDYATKEELNSKQDAITDLETIRQGATKGATSVQQGTLSTVATSGSYNDLTNKPTIPAVVTESTVSNWGFAKSSALQTKAEDSSVVHKTGNETIAGAKTFNNGVNFLGNGDSNAITLSTDTRINVNGTNKTVLGFGTGTFYINHGEYTLLLRGKDTRPKYNNTTLALSSDIPAAVTESTVSGWGFTKNAGTYSKPSGGIPKSDLASAVQTSLGKADTALQSHQDISGKQDTLVSGTNIKTINGTSILGSGNIITSTGSTAYTEVDHGTSDTTFTLVPNTFHVWGAVSTLTLTLGTKISGVANEYLFQFTSGSEPTTLILPNSIKFNSDFTVEANKIYQISILNGLGTVMSWENNLKLITFTVGGVKYEAEENMTWEEWCNSEYNTDGFYISNNLTYKGDKYIYSYGEPYTVILNNGEYTLYQPGGGAN